MRTVWSDSSVVKVHAHSERVQGLSQRWVIGGGEGAGMGVNDIHEEKAYDQTGT